MLIIAGALVGLSAPAQAADWYSKAPPQVYAPVDPGPNWTSIHIGVNGGGTWSIAPFTESDRYTVARFARNYPNYVDGMIKASLMATAQPVRTQISSGVVGGQIGMDWQVSRFVVGIEADYDRLLSPTASGGVSALLTVPGGQPMTLYSQAYASRSLDYLATFRTRFGVLAKPQLLLYGTVGLAFGHVSGDYFIYQGVNVPMMWKVADRPWAGGSSYSKTMVGYTVGGGLEWMFYRGFSIRAEYLYYRLGGATMTGWANTDPTGIMVGPEWWSVANARTRYAGHVARAGLNYYFSGFNTSGMWRR